MTHERKLSQVLFRHDFCCQVFSNLIGCAGMSEIEYEYRIPFTGSPRGNLYRIIPAGYSGTCYEYIGPAYTNEAGALHYFEHGDLCRLGRDEFYTEFS